MKRRLLRGLHLLCAALALGLALQAMAAQKVALLIGNNEYLDRNAKLSNAVNDATDLAQALTGLGFKVIVRKDATIDQLKEAVREFGSALDGAEVALFFYAGHAMQFQGNNYLLPVNASLRSERDVLLDGFDVANILYLMGTGKSKNFVILDACRDNPFKDRFRAATGLAQMSAPADSLIAYSTAPGSVAYDGNGRNGIYTKNLLRQIGSTGIDALKMFSQVGEAVQRETVTQKPPQVPWLLSSLRGQFSFNATGSAVAAAPSQGSAALGPSADTQINAERVFWESLDKSRPDELALYLERFPRGLYADLARRRIAAAQQASGPATPPAPAPAAAQAASPTPAASAAPPPASAPAAGAPPAASERITVASNSAARADGNDSASRGIQSDATPTQREIRYDDGTVYSGTVVNGMAQGRGTYTGRDGFTYVGDFVAGKRTGQGKLKLPNGDEYEGDFVDDRMHGKGVYRKKSGDIYSGDIADNLFHGQGSWQFADGSRYRGSVSKNIMTGQGEFTFTDGSRYVGQFEKDRPHGRGTYSFPNGDRYEGQFAQGEFEGEGFLNFASGLKYQGTFSQGKANGNGSLLFANGSRFDGVFQMGTDNAKGTLTGASGDKSPAEIVSGQVKRL